MRLREDLTLCPKCGGQGYVNGETELLTAFVCLNGHGWTDCEHKRLTFRADYPTTIHTVEGDDGTLRVVWFYTDGDGRALSSQCLDCGEEFDVGEPPTLALDAAEFPDLRAEGWTQEWGTPQEMTEEALNA